MNKSIQISQVTGVNWLNNQIQFPRLIAEAQVAGAFSGTVVATMAEEMDLTMDELHGLIDRACDEWDKIKAKTK